MIKLGLISGRSGAAIIGGDWDLKVPRVTFVQKDVYKACYQRWIEGREWGETEIYRKYVRQLERGIPCRFGSVKDLEERYAELDRIYDEVLVSGALDVSENSLVKIHFLRDGTCAWGPDGRHRICMALLAGHEYIPAKVGFVHPLACGEFEAARLPHFRADPD
ncbi:hypothetical protein [Thioalkalivibrio sp. ALJ16]|uniref:hypothetical protein n=1 Tax=Thioalkalivibrio sp. ALJ16 TaxID=1158762 RepID=UPI0012DDACAB|nr:hypothetical protein [Thioalkalivibrio sp. ALJ16]